MKVATINANPEPTKPKIAYGITVSIIIEIKQAPNPTNILTITAFAVIMRLCRNKIPAKIGNIKPAAEKAYVATIISSTRGYTKAIATANTHTTIDMILDLIFKSFSVASGFMSFLYTSLTALTVTDCIPLATVDIIADTINPAYIGRIYNTSATPIKNDT